jgi:hypothetical protein
VVEGSGFESRAAKLTGRESPDDPRRSQSDEPTPTGPKCPDTGGESNRQVHAIDVETALAEALAGATRAQRWDVVAQLARELEARRLASSGNVVAIRARRTRGD